MADLNENKIPNGEVLDNELDTSQDYLATIAELKRNSVSKTDYEKLRQENRNLLQTLVEGGQIQQNEIKPEVNVNELRQELFTENSGLNNLQYVSKALELRDALIEKGEPDPFIPISSKNAPTDEEIRTAEKVASAFKECIEYADGDSQIFTQELMRITADVGPIGGRTSRKR